MKKVIMLILAVISVGAIASNASAELEDHMQLNVGIVDNDVMDYVKANIGKCHIKRPQGTKMESKELNETITVGRETLICTSDGWVNTRYLGKP